MKGCRELAQILDGTKEATMWCCNSCHVDYEDFGFPFIEVTDDAGTTYLVCCAMAAELSEARELGYLVPPRETHTFINLHRGVL